MLRARWWLFYLWTGSSEGRREGGRGVEEGDGGGG